MEEAAKLPRQEALTLARVLDANRLTRLAYEVLTQFDDSIIREPKAELRRKVRVADEAMKSREEVLRTLSGALSQSDIAWMLTLSSIHQTSLHAWRLSTLMGSDSSTILRSDMQQDSS
jgi:hypothetical protein